MTQPVLIVQVMILNNEFKQKIECVLHVYSTYLKVNNFNQLNFYHDLLNLKVAS